MLQKYFGSRTFVFLFVYAALLAFSLVSVAITCDEYDGGNALADFGTWLFDYYSFPVFSLLDYWQLLYSSDNNGIILVLLAVNLVLNCLCYLFILETGYRQLKKMGMFFIRSKARS